MPQTDPSRGDPDSIGQRDLARWDTRLGRWLVSLVTGVVRPLRPAAGRAAAWSLGNLAFVVFSVLALGVISLLVDGAQEVFEAVVGGNGLTAVDRPVLDAMVSVRNPTLDAVMTAFTNIGGPVGMPLLATVVVAVITLRRRRWTPVVVTVIAAAGSLLMTVVGKDLVGRARPPASLAVPPFEISPSFPSGHTLNATVLTTVVVYLLLIETTAVWQRVTSVVAGLCFVVTMGLSRVYLGHHWLTDVVAGWAVGFAWALAVITAHRLWLTLRDDGRHDGGQDVPRNPPAPSRRGRTAR
ncbi:MAG: phosphatase PAP2 family protein [Terracoccus sp.]